MKHLLHVSLPVAIGWTVAVVDRQTVLSQWPFKSMKQLASYIFFFFFFDSYTSLLHHCQKGKFGSSSLKTCYQKLWLNKCLLESDILSVLLYHQFQNISPLKPVCTASKDKPKINNQYASKCVKIHIMDLKVFFSVFLIIPNSFTLQQ